MSLNSLRRLINLGLAAMVVIAGSAFFVWQVRTGPKPAVHPPVTHAHSVAVAAAQSEDGVVPVVGHGTVRPKRQVNVIPQVNGKLTFVHEDMGEGKIINEGALLFEVDPVIYESRVEQGKAEIRGLEGTLAQHEAELESLKERIATAARRVEIAKENYETSKGLRQNDSVAQTVLLADEQVLLTQVDLKEQLEARARLIPHFKESTQAQLDAAQARLSQAQHDLENTKLLCPFDARVEKVSAHLSQVVTAPLSIATLTDMEAFEISVGIDPREIRWLVESAQPSALAQTDLENPAEVVVRATGFGREIEWRGYVTRFERVDEATRTARMVVEVRNEDMAGSVSELPGARGTMLSIGMFCRTELPSRPLDNALFVPRHAIYEGGLVYVFEPDGPDAATGRLGVRHVPLLRTAGDRVLVDFEGRDSDELCELQTGEQVVVSPLIKPVVGMKVQLRDAQMARTDEHIPFMIGENNLTDEHPLLAGLTGQNESKPSTGPMPFVAVVARQR